MTAFAGPWGVSFAANLTPDKETGLGSWTEEFPRALIWTGSARVPDAPFSRPCPYQLNLGPLTDEDLGAVFAYLPARSPRSRNQVPQPLEPRVAGQGEPAHAPRGTR